MATQELSDYVTGLSTASLDGAKELYLQTDEKTTVGALKVFTTGKVYKAQISQSGTSAPTLTELVNTFGVIVNSVYNGVGVYSLTGFTGLITGLTEVSITFPNDGINSAFAGGTISTNIVIINTFISGVQANGVLNNDPSITKFGTSVITVTKYD